MRRWLQFLWRRRTLPIPRKEAEKKKHRLSLVYLFCSWNAAGLALYVTIKNHYPETEQEKTKPGLYYARLLQSDNVHVYKVEKFRVTGEYQINETPPLIPDDTVDIPNYEDNVQYSENNEISS